MQNPAERSVLGIIWRDAAMHKKALNALALFLLAALVFLFRSFLKELFILAAFIFASAVSRLWQRIFPVSMGANLIMLFTVLAGVLYGSTAGMIVGFLSLFISAILVQEDVLGSLPALFSIAFVGYVAGIIPFSNIFIAGLALTVLFDAMISIGYLAIGIANANTALFVLTHIVFNYFVFYYIAPPLLKLLA